MSAPQARMYFLSIAVTASLVSSTIAAPLLPNDTSTAGDGNTPNSYGTLLAQSDPRLDGINLFYAQGECGHQRVVQLQGAFQDVSNLAHAPLMPSISRADPSFQQFFGIGYIGSKSRFYERIFDNFRKAADFPFWGTFRDPLKESNQISVHCEDIENRCKGNVAMYIGNNPRQPGTYMVMCPYFWSKGFPRLADRVNGRKTTDLNSLVTVEHLILHELMHADITGITPHITDVKASLPTSHDPVVPVYGVQRCMQLAAKKSPNPVTSHNADNYAWFATAVYFNNIWGIRPRARRDTAVSDGPTGDDVTWADNDVVSEDDPDLLRYDLDATTSSVDGSDLEASPVDVSDLEATTSSVNVSAMA